MQEGDILQFLLDHSDYFTRSNFLLSICRTLVWWIIKGLVWLTDISQEFYEKCFEFLDFTTYGPLQDFMNEMRPVLFIILTVAIVLIGLTLMFRPRKKPPVVTNLLIGMFVFCSFTTIMSSLNSGMLYSKDYIINSYGTSSAAIQIVENNITDLIYVDNVIGLKNMKQENIPHAALSEQAFQNLKINDVVEPKSKQLATSEAGDILKKEAVYMPNNKDGVQQDYVLDDVKDEFLGDGWYYRYYVHFFLIILSLVSLVVVFLVMGYKVIRLIWELITSQFLAILLSGEIFSGQGLKKLLDFIKNLYIVMFYTLISIKLYLLASQYINTKFSSGVAGLILLCLAFAVADGPVVVEKILGLDAGLQSGVGKLVAASHMVTGAVRTVQYANMQHRMNKGMNQIGKALGEAGNKGANPEEIRWAGRSRNSHNQSTSPSKDNSAGGGTNPVGTGAGKSTTGEENPGMPSNFSKSEDSPSPSGSEFNDTGYSQNEFGSAGNNEDIPGNISEKGNERANAGPDMPGNFENKKNHSESKTGEGKSASESRKTAEKDHTLNNRSGTSKQNMPTGSEAGKSSKSRLGKEGLNKKK